MVPFSTALLLGFIHGLGADHLMAIAALAVAGGGSAGEGRLRALGVAVRFAVGHALLLLAGVAVVMLVGWQIPTAVERTGELVGGSLLILLGLAGLWALATGRVYGHSHPHGEPPHAHWHLHVGRPERHPLPGRHSHVPTVLGAVFAVSGLRALTLMIPLDGGSSVVTPAALFGLIVLFALGILVSMVLFGVVLAHLLSTRIVAGLGRAAAAMTALASLALGAYWVIR